MNQCFTFLLVLFCFQAFCQDAEKKSNKRKGVANAIEEERILIDSPIYLVTLKSGTEYYCNINSKTDGEFMSITKYNGGVQFIQWDEMKEYKLTPYKATSKELFEIKRKDEIELKYKYWDRCYVIRTGMDTLRGWIKSDNDYSENTKHSWDDANIRVVDGNGQSHTFPPSYYDELIVFGHDTRRFLSIASGGNPQNKNLYSILVDGPCKLVTNSVHSGETSMPVMGAGGGVGMMPVMERDREWYYIYHKGVLTKMRAESKESPIAAYAFEFKAKSREIFAACPELVEEIENKKLRSTDLKAIVEEFNRCLAAKRDK